MRPPAPRLPQNRPKQGEDYEADPQIDDDPDLVSPGPRSFSSPASGKRRIQEAFDLEAQESARRAAGKAAVKRALAGNMAAAGADPFSQIDREPSDTGMHKNEPGAGWRVSGWASGAGGRAAWLGECERRFRA
jgi:hypothetical protein